jgi:hypothetical protein
MEIIIQKAKLEYDDGFCSGEFGDFYIGDFCMGSVSKNKKELLKKAIGKSVKLVVIIPELPEGDK